MFTGLLFSALGLAVVLSVVRSCVSFPEEDAVAVRNEIYGTNKSWTFDKVFRPEATQAQVYEEVANLVVSMLDGYNICVFAYGQTGSGKTHSMQGTPQEQGIYRRTFRNYFEVTAPGLGYWPMQIRRGLCVHVFFPPRVQF